jgi:soluble lytic murein transglycosylase-like protein
MRNLFLLLFAFALSASAVFGAEDAPRAALQYRSTMIRTVHYVWGMNGPTAVMSAQIQQESGWNPDAESKFAKGLGQFTPQTAEWISGAYRKDLGGAQPLNPAWAIRALIQYDYYLHERVKAASPCDRWAFSLAGYNGGEGWIARDRALTVRAGGDPLKWWGNVEAHSARAAWAFAENRGYPKRILLKLQPAYLTWGPGVECPGVSGD